MIKPTRGDRFAIEQQRTFLRHVSDMRDGVPGATARNFEGPAFACRHREQQLVVFSSVQRIFERPRAGHLAQRGAER